MRYYAVLLLVIATICAVTFHISMIVSKQQSITMDRTLSLSSHSAQELMECYDRRKNTIALVPANEFWNNPTCSFDFRQRVLFMHMGKSGGRTVDTIQSEHYRFLSSKCHPHPGYCQKKLPQAEQIIMTIRDPVDRFVSAFHWRSYVLCNKDSTLDTRTRNHATGRLQGSHPHEVCSEQKWDLQERDILHESYQYDINELAQDLCDDGPFGDKARQATTKIGHLKSPLADWLDFILTTADNNGEDESRQQQQDDTPKPYPSLQQVMAIVMESGDDSAAGAEDHPLEETVSNALEYLIRKEYPNAPPDFFSRGGEDARTSKLPSATNLMHTSRDINIFPGTSIAKTPISPLGECCIARHLAKDYEILKVLASGGSSASTASTSVSLDPRLAKACQWGTKEDSQECQDMLQSMIRRRQPYLEDMSLSCQQVVDSLSSSTTS